MIVGICHCKHCQRRCGSAFSVVAAVPASAFRLPGKVETFCDIGDSGNTVRRNFCPFCGPSFMSKVTAAPELIWVKAGTLDDTSRLRPTMQIYCDKAQPWIALEGRESYPGMPNLYKPMLTIAERDRAAAVTNRVCSRAGRSIGVILWGVRCYVTYPLSYRQIEETMQEQGVEVDHSTLHHSVLKYVPQLESCLVAEHCWDPVGLAIADYAYRFQRLRVAPQQE